MRIKSKKPNNSMLTVGLRIKLKDSELIGTIEKHCIDLGMKKNEHKCYYVRWDNGHLGIVDDFNLITI